MDNLLPRKTTDAVVYCFTGETQQELENLRDGSKKEPDNLQND